jgi:hypothetical protein
MAITVEMWRKWLKRKKVSETVWPYARWAAVKRERQRRARRNASLLKRPYFPQKRTIHDRNPGGGIKRMKAG